MANILDVKNLKISFRTTNGQVKAVRDISFSLEKGKTLAIVGESGSGKSVTSKAILGILAGNAIVESGEIHYDGKDLLKISEEDMCEIRGDKISMIFQDPLSSLNPIVKIGKQITEAMLLKNKTSRKEARTQFNNMLKLLQEHMIAAQPEKEAEIKEMIQTFDRFCIEANKLENSYNTSSTTAAGLVSSIEDFLFRMSKNQNLDVKAVLKHYKAELKKIADPYFTAESGAELNALAEELTAAIGTAGKEEGLSEHVSALLNKLKTLLEKMQAQKTPNFFRIGFYAMKNPGEDLSKKSAQELEDLTLNYLNENFMFAFIDAEMKGVEHSFNTYLEKKKAVLPKLAEAKAYYQGELVHKAAVAYAKALADQVEDSIDRLVVTKDIAAYTFRSTLMDAIERYFSAVKNNPLEEARFARQTKKREALIAKGKNVDWKVIPKNVYDLEELKADILTAIDRLEQRYEMLIAQAGSVDFKARSIEIIDYLRDKASKVVYVVTPAMAKERAIELMEEVGIAEPRMRFYQYPFEFSGGMRQRIVIAIALSANPGILICDEPTTALDVTIQAQILKLIKDLQKEFGYTIVFITHDLGVVANVADRVAVLYAGQMIELGTAEEVFYDPRHPYTWALLSSLPQLAQRNTKLYSITGTPPSLYNKIVGDAFAPRNPYCLRVDTLKEPPMFQVSDTHFAKTWLLDPRAPKVEKPEIIQNIHEKLTDAFNI